MSDVLGGHRYILSDDRRWITIADRRYPVWRASVEDLELGDERFPVFRTRQVRLMFESALSASVIWGSSTHSSNYDAMLTGEWHERPASAEVAVMSGEVVLGEPFGWVTPEEAVVMLEQLARGERPRMP